MKTTIQYILSFAVFLIGAMWQYGKAQTLPVGTPVLEDYYRRLQLLGKIDSNLSFNIRPLSAQALGVSDLYHAESDHIADKSILWRRGKDEFAQLLPVIWENQYTSAFPTGYNDGAMIPNVGYQTFLSVGFFIKYKFLSVQFRPEMVYAQNKAYPIFTGGTENAMQVWYDFYNNIDMPTRFGNDAYFKLLPGQSSIRVNFDPVSIGLSTENLWWGPGIRNSLVMSNTAPGFTHVTLNSVRPIKSNIGSFEGQVIAGRLTSSGYAPRSSGQESNFEYLYEPKPDSWRYISGAIFSYQPKWVPGLFLGLTQSFVVYRDQMGNRINDYLPFLGPSSGTTSTGEAETGEAQRNRDRYSSFFTRWVMPKGKAEFYAEYGRNEPAWNTRDFIVEPDHSRAYTLGFRKLVPLKKENDYLQIGVELTQISKSRTSSVREYESWYSSSIVRDGYTNMGQILGAGIGPGSNVQSFTVSWLRGLKQIGLLFERQEQQTDMFYQLLSFSSDYRRNWVNLSATLNGEWDYKKLLLTAKLKFTNGLNFNYDLQEKAGGSFWDFNPQDQFNFQGQLGVMYRF